MSYQAANLITGITAIVSCAALVFAAIFVSVRIHRYFSRLERAEEKREKERADQSARLDEMLEGLAKGD